MALHHLGQKVIANILPDDNQNILKYWANKLLKINPSLTYPLSEIFLKSM